MSDHNRAPRPRHLEYAFGFDSRSVAPPTASGIIRVPTIEAPRSGLASRRDADGTVLGRAALWRLGSVDGTMPAAPMESVFDEVASRSGLPLIIRRAALKRALERAGLAPERLTAANLASALAEIHLTLQVYLEEAEIPGRVQSIRALVRERE